MSRFPLKLTPMGGTMVTTIISNQTGPFILKAWIALMNLNLYFKPRENTLLKKNMPSL